MSTDYPYSQQWRERTRERMEALHVTFGDLLRACGRECRLAAAGHVDDVSLEHAGPVDEWLDRLEEELEAETLHECVVHHPGVGSPTVRRVEGVDLGALVDCRIRFEEVVP